MELCPCDDIEQEEVEHIVPIFDVDWDPSARDLRIFIGVWFLAFWGIVGAWVGYKTGNWSLAVGIWTIAGWFAVVGLLYPRAIRPVYTAWVAAAWPIGWLVGHLILAAIFFLVLTPIGMLMRLVGRDPMHRSFDRKADSYWIRRTTKSDPARYFRQF